MAQVVKVMLQKLSRASHEQMCQNGKVIQLVYIKFYHSLQRYVFDCACAHPRILKSVSKSEVICISSFQLKGLAAKYSTVKGSIEVSAYHMFL